MCPIESCRSVKKRMCLSSGYNVSGGLSSDGCGSDGEPEVESHTLPQRQRSYGNGNSSYHQSSLLQSLHLMESGSLPEDSPDAKRIDDMAEKIMQQLDNEKPLLPKNFNSMSSNSVVQDRPHSGLVPGSEATYYPLLYPIVERSEDLSSPSYGGPRSLFNNSFQSQPESLGPMSSELDGVTGMGSGNGLPSVGSNSLGGDEDRVTVYPQQRVVFNFNIVSESGD